MKSALGMVAPDVEIDDGKGTSLFAKLHLYEINVFWSKKYTNSGINEWWKTNEN